MNQQKRQAAILKILQYIQTGGDSETAKKMFQENFDQVDVAEITSAERQLIADGLDPRQIQALCDVHADVFKGNIKQTDENPEFAKPGHPVKTFKLENTVIKSLVTDYLQPKMKQWVAKHDEKTLTQIRQALADLATIDQHYARKETSMFPLMNKYGITAPPEVMWGVDDDIRRQIKTARKLAAAEHPDPEQLAAAIKQVSQSVLGMIFKEQEIMLPMLAEVADAEDWYHVKQEEQQIGYTLINPPMNWHPRLPKKAAGAVNVQDLSGFFINFQEGRLNLQQLQAIMGMLPFALTFIDADDRVAYFGGGAEIYPHSQNALGNKVFLCHQAQARPLIKKIFHQFHTGEKDKYEFWFKLHKTGRYLYLRYYAVHDEDGKYLGCLEVAQDVTEIRAWTSEQKTI
ncbi:MAG: DUF438 domain-containing protein [Lactobacillus sp.]|nr:DUF438 domain-containing protein [Lactobacillus sp.]MCH3905851.1 DUF438 domain-containing protein [Lactobacillus sp.]MCH3990567.1 DUF438 domain-containing protein [Lactobacillus sp.]MCH4068718.1 DUF438 domain-containing protein [Lactobacillus sp.]MCI1303797.1 DUF438 domain-containing protein [Lactobacillus sp.]